jgi:hypothetical protein
MKRIYYLVIMIAAGLGSCKKFLDTKPTDVYTTENYYNTEAQLQQALNSAYGDLMTPSLYAQILGFNFTTSTDEVLSNRTADGDARGLRYNYDATNVYVGSIWRYCYLGINNINMLLDNINRPVMDSAKRSIIKGQALFLRGYYYFLLTSNYGDVPVVLHSPGITDVTIVPTPQKGVYQQAEKDMKDAEGLLQNYTSASLGYNDVVTLTAVQATLARVYLYWAGYPQNEVSKYNDVLTYTNKVVSSGKHALNPDYRQIFINLCQDRYDVKEDIWEIGSAGAAAGIANKGGNDIGNFVGITSSYIVGDTASYGSASWVSVTKKLYDAYAVDPASIVTPNKASFDIAGHQGQWYLQYQLAGDTLCRCAADAGRSRELCERPRQCVCGYQQRQEKRLRHIIWQCGESNHRDQWRRRLQRHGPSGSDHQRRRGQRRHCHSRSFHGRCGNGYYHNQSRQFNNGRALLYQRPDSDHRRRRRRYRCSRDNNGH